MVDLAPSFSGIVHSVEECTMCIAEIVVRDIYKTKALETIIIRT